MPARPSGSPPDPPSPRVEFAELLEAEFGRRWPGRSVGLDAVHRYAMIPPGKLLRPLLVLHAALTVGGELGAVLPAAVGIEGAHVGSLLHDDIIDRDTQRRGRAAVHTEFGPAQAVVAGNALFFSWFAALSECGRLGVPADRVERAMAVQAEAGVAICRGAFDELAMRGDLELGVGAYVAMARAKTAVLLAAACRVGAILGGGDAPTTELLGDFGDHLGICFQIRDDVLPYDPIAARAMGKPSDSDVRNRRPTLPVLIAHRRADPKSRAALRHALLDETEPELALCRIRAVLERTGALDTAHAMADDHARRARELLTRLPATAHVAHVRALALLTRPAY
ncbi:geranylgeranyl diphosphate synthase, type I [Streptomyces sp. OV198]|uniref:polyprenyl synthetase family protein n=1 Tax=Streptomyces sp. OV198 TaxID=1882787 RepID=UPI000BD90267|nr:polyprenyl synthetase family protein [Streptomyces sp. OV198]SOE58217.1 geranylgeranyl diphosphate synthase, type I [Streptomyces sp. OV198]